MEQRADDAGPAERDDNHDQDVAGFGIISLDPEWVGDADRRLQTADAAPSITEVLDLALLDRLLGVQEAATIAAVDARNAECDLTKLTETVDQLRIEADVSRSAIVSLREQLEDEHFSLALAEAKNVELENRLRREEEQAREERSAARYANMRSLRREREAALAAGAMGWWSRRRYRRLQGVDSIG